MDRNIAVKMAQDAIKKKNKRLVDAVLKTKAERDKKPKKDLPVDQLPLIAVTCATGWECYAIVEELVATQKFRVRALYRTPGTQAATRINALCEKTEGEYPGLLTVQSGVDMNSEETLTMSFEGCDGIVLYTTANTAKAGKVTSHGYDPKGGRAAVMRQVMAALGALKANPSVQQVITLIFPTDKVNGIVDDAPAAPWWIHQKLRLSDFLRDQGINVTCIYRPAYYFNMHRVDRSDALDIRGESQMSKTLIKENSVPGINDPDFMVNWVDVRDIGKWTCTCLEYPEIFKNRNLSIASCALTGQELTDVAQRINKHGTKFNYKQFPPLLMKTLSLFTEEVVYPLRYSQWYNDKANGYDFACEEDLADLDRIHPRWTIEKKLESWGIDQIKPEKA